MVLRVLIETEGWLIGAKARGEEEELSAGAVLLEQQECLLESVAEVEEGISMWIFEAQHSAQLHLAADHIDQQSWSHRAGPLHHCFLGSTHWPSPPHV